MHGNCQYTLRNKLQWNLNRHTKLFIHVCEMAAILSRGRWVNTLRPGPNGPFCRGHIQMHLATEKCCILFQTSLKFVPNDPFDNNPKLVKILTWHQTGDESLSRPMTTLFPDSKKIRTHYNDVIITSLTPVYWSVYSGADQNKHQSSASLALVRGIHPWPVNSLHKGPVTRRLFLFDDVIMVGNWLSNLHQYLLFKK